MSVMDHQSKETTDNQMDSNASPPMSSVTMDVKVSDDLGIDEPQNWPVSKKITASLGAFGHTYALLYGLTCYTVGTNGVAKEFGVSSTLQILPFSLYLWGIMFAPLYSPHVSEKFGRNKFYLVATLGLGVFTLGAAYSKTYTQLAVCRFFAGLFGGSNAVQIEGTFADVWSREFTNTYYPFIACAQYFGAASGAIIGAHVVAYTNWRWTQYTTLMFVLAALFLGMGVPETYRRELVRRRAKALKQPNPLMPALSGSTFREMVQYTIINPPVMLVKQPLVLMITLYLGLNFGFLFASFILVPQVLIGVAKFDLPMVGTAVVTALVGTSIAAILTIIIDQLAVRYQHRRFGPNRLADIELRLIPVMIGACVLTASLFWVGWTANPNHKPIVSIVGTGASVCGSAMTVIGFVAYLFDAYKPDRILSALTMAACFRLAMAGVIPLTILISVGDIGGSWTLSTYGFISIAFLPFPFIIFAFGKKWRANSGFGPMMMDTMHEDMKMMPDHMPSHQQA